MSVRRPGSATTSCCNRPSAIPVTPRFFIKSEADFRRHEHEIVGEGEIKIMKRIDCRGSAIEACATKAGHDRRAADDRVGRFQSADALSRRLVRERNLRHRLPAEGRASSARELTFKFGEQLRKEGLSRLFRTGFPDRQERPAISGSAS